MQPTALEHALLTMYKTEMVAFLNAHPEYFVEAINLAMSDRLPLAWRAAWLLHDCMEFNDQRVQPYAAAIINFIPTKKEGHQRELLKILMKMELDDHCEGKLFDHCISIWEKVQNSSSARYTAFINVLKMAEKYPELSNEIVFFTQSQYLETLSPGIKHSLILKSAKLISNINR